VARWHEQIGDPTAADGILDRLVHNAHRIDMRGDSMRKKTWSAAVELSAEAGTKGCRPLPRTLFSASGTLPPLRSGQFQTGFS
jgi:hypothetical protein